MFFLTFLRRELLRRMHRAVFVALGLSVGVGLVVTVTAASTGVSNAQTKVLHALYGIGTDVTVTKAASSKRDGTLFSFSPGKVPVRHNYMIPPPGLGVIDGAAVARVAKVHGVIAAAGAMSLLDTDITVPSQSQLSASGKPPAGSLGNHFTVNGVDLAHLKLGPYASGTIGSGRSLAASDARSDVAVADAGYANAHGLKVGSTMSIAGHDFRVVGVTRQPRGGGSADFYIPLTRAQAYASSPETKAVSDKIDTIYVAVTNTAAIPAVRTEINRLLPGTTVTSSSSLADDVTGSLTSATSLATDLGRWLAIVALITAFAAASLLTAANVARRTREFGTLRTLGWRTRRIIGQILGESVVTGLAGAVAGIALGFLGAALVGWLAPELTATVAQNPGSPPSENITLNSSGMRRSISPYSTHTINVHLDAQVTLAAIGLAVGLALIGGIIAGLYGGWRISRLRPAEALRRVE
ncbi:ABC transporter permease [Actinomadura rayongensis]|uniref:FtsX-like permease family protein n=1 Tax=Actinomadura rayongensis TaxID=1429076 RepID=A0A6I4W7G8_9ACTN|nr:ABC transporter permease [Actinomadura rayongensis]MXQ65548.1 FtsX-like permease family protein [Actinomadura rayongensis]